MLQDIINDDFQGREALEHGKAKILENYPDRQDAVDVAWDYWSFPSRYIHCSRQVLIDGMLEIAEKIVHPYFFDPEFNMSKLNFNALRGCISQKKYPQIQRLETLLNGSILPTVVVLGKYNYGKSSLLNALVDGDCFKVSDVRETTEVSWWEYDGIRWGDTPGLDADVDAEDDRRALDAARREADIRLFVHSLVAGELDAEEFNLLQELHQEQADSGRPVLLVLTRLDEVDSDALSQIISKIKHQIPDLAILPVSARNYRKGKNEGKPKLLASSHFDALTAAIREAAQESDAGRKEETRRLASRLIGQLDTSALQEQLQELQEAERNALKKFQRELAHLQARLHKKITEN